MLKTYLHDNTFAFLRPRIVLFVRRMDQRVILFVLFYVLSHPARKKGRNVREYFMIYSRRMEIQLECCDQYNDTANKSSKYRWVHVICRTQYPTLSVYMLTRAHHPSEFDLLNYSLWTRRSSTLQSSLFSHELIFVLHKDWGRGWLSCHSSGRRIPSS